MATQHERISGARQVISALEELRDELHVKTHLGTMEAKQHWDHLEEQVVQLQAEFEREGERVGDTAREAMLAVLAVLPALLKRIQQTRLLPQEKVSAVMQTNVLTCSRDHTLAHAADLMWKGDCGSIPVIDQDRRLVGIITDRDVCMAAYTQGQRLSETHVGSAMAHVIYTSSPDATLVEALYSMRERQLHRLPVVDQNQTLIGIVSLGDICRYLNSHNGPRGAVSDQDWIVSTIASISEPRSATPPSSTLH